MRYDYLVVGVGLFGAVFAHEAAAKGKRVLVIDRRPQIAGNVYTEDIEGIHVHKYGAHIFHTNDRRVWDYVNRFATFNRFTNSPVANYKGELYSLPFNMYTFNKMWGVVTPEEAAAKIESQKREYIASKLRERGESSDANASDRDTVTATGEAGAETEKVSKTVADTSSVRSQSSAVVTDGKNNGMTEADAQQFVPQNLEEQAISLVGTDIYEKLIKGYTEKQWGRPCTELPAFIIKRLPVRLTFDNNYFNALYQGIPIGGYTKLVANMLNCDLNGEPLPAAGGGAEAEKRRDDAPKEALAGSIEVRLGVDFLKDREALTALVDKIVYTGAIDEYFDYRLGALEYRSVRFETEVLDQPNFQGNAAVNYTDRETPWTRIIEHKWFEFGKNADGNDLPKTVISREYSSEWKPGDEPYYPVNDTKNLKLYQKYHALAAKEPNIIFGGRLGEYKYYDMDKVIASALDCAAQELD